MNNTKILILVGIIAVLLDACVGSTNSISREDKLVGMWLMEIRDTDTSFHYSYLYRDTLFLKADKSWYSHSGIANYDNNGKLSNWRSNYRFGGTLWHIANDTLCRFVNKEEKEPSWSNYVYKLTDDSLIFKGHWDSPNHPEWTNAFVRIK